jgi:hypothetical protein
MSQLMCLCTHMKMKGTKGHKTPRSWICSVFPIFHLGEWHLNHVAYPLDPGKIFEYIIVMDLLFLESFNLQERTLVLITVNISKSEIYDHMPGTFQISGPLCYASLLDTL